MIIETLNPTELDSFYQIFSKILSQEFPGYSPSVVKYFLEKVYTKFAFRYWIDQKLKSILIAKENTNIVGFAVIDQSYGGVSFCRWLGVLPGHQRKGIGRAFIQKWTEIAKQEGAHKMEVAAQPEAKEFYAKAGMELEGTRKKSYFGIDQYVYGTILKSPTDEDMIRY